MGVLWFSREGNLDKSVDFVSTCGKLISPEDDLDPGEPSPSKELISQSWPGSLGTIQEVEFARNKRPFVKRLDFYNGDRTSQNQWYGGLLLVLIYYMN